MCKDKVSGDLALLDADNIIHYISVCDQAINKILDSAINRADSQSGVSKVMDVSLENVQLAHRILLRLFNGTTTEKDVVQLDRWKEQHGI